MNIGFDAAPLIDARRSGIGYCQAGLVEALTRLYPEHSYRLQYLSLRHGAEKAARLAPYLKEHVTAKAAFCSPLGYRAVTTLLPLPYRLFFGGKNDITHFFNYIVPPVVGGKTVVTVHDMVIKAFPETVRGRTKLLLNTGLERSMKRADRIITDSDFSKSEIIKYYPAARDKLRVVYCGVDTTRFFPLDDPAAIDAVKRQHGIDGDYFLYLGTLEPRKNLERLVRAYALLCESHPDAPLLVLAGGKGWLCEGLHETIQTLKMQDRVRFTEYLPGEQMCPLMNGATAFVFPSVYEGFGMPPLEAMACGVPVLTSTAASLPEVVGDCAVLVHPERIEEIADGLQRIWRDEPLRARLRENGPKRAAEFSWDSAARALMSVYLELM